MTAITCKAGRNLNIRASTGDRNYSILLLLLLLVLILLVCIVRLLLRILLLIQVLRCILSVCIVLLIILRNLCLLVLLLRRRAKWNLNICTRNCQSRLCLSTTNCVCVCARVFVCVNVFCDL